MVLVLLVVTGAALGPQILSKKGTEVVFYLWALVNVFVFAFPCAKQRTLPNAYFPASGLKSSSVSCG
jgi:hypothetical protein